MAEVQEDSIFLPEALVRKSPGFSVDVGSSLIKTVYRSKKDFINGELINDEAVKGSLARVYMFQVPRASGCKQVIDILKEKCDLKSQGDSKEKVQVTVTGMGSNFFRNELEESSNVKLVVQLEGHCANVGFKLMAEQTPMEELVYPKPEEDLAAAQKYADVYSGYFKTSGTTSQEHYSRLTHCETPIPDGTKPHLPCLLITCGSGNIITKLDADGNAMFLDTNMVAGIAFLGFSSYIHGPINFEDLISKLESTDGKSVDAMLSDMVASGSGSEMKTGRRVLPYAKLPGIKDPEKVKKEDVTLSFLKSIAEVQGQLTHVHCLAHQVRKVYFVGSFINIALVRRVLTEKIEGRNLMRPECQRIEFNFVKRGGFMIAIGAFAEGGNS